MTSGSSPSIFSNGYYRLEYAFEAAGDRVQQTYTCNTATYLLDIAFNLTQMLADGESTYLYGLGRIGEECTGAGSTITVMHWAPCAS